MKQCIIKHRHYPVSPDCKLYTIRFLPDCFTFGRRWPDDLAAVAWLNLGDVRNAAAESDIDCFIPNR